jgi:hypothetical protein
MKNHQKVHQNVIFRGHVEVQKESEDISAGIGILRKLSYLISFPAI